MTYTTLTVKNKDVVRTCNDLLKKFLGSEELDALQVSQEVPSKRISFPVLISDPKLLDANIFAPVMPTSTASIISSITKLGPADRKIGAVMRSCQIRALIELVKLNQASLDNIVIIGVDCPGTYPVNTYSDFPEKKTPTNFILDSLGTKNSKAENYLRSACLACYDPIPTNADIVIGLYGTDIRKELVIQANTEAGERLVDLADLKKLKDTKHRENGTLEIRERRQKNRMEFMEKHGNIKGIEALAGFYDKCINCHNCMKVCPICYCRECLFESSLFDVKADKYLRKARSKKLFKMPPGSLLFHVTRMQHMILSCVSCGLCEQACPNGIPLMDLLISVAENAQRALDYRPGKDIQEKSPMVVYQEDEYSDVGED